MPPDVYSLIEYMYMAPEVGNVTAREARRGSGSRNLDRRIVSVLVDDLMRQRGPGRVKMVPRNISADRFTTSHRVSPSRKKCPLGLLL